MQQNNPKKKRNSLSRLLWWNIDGEELREQIAKYETLKITRSARGISCLCLLFCAAAISFLIYTEGNFFLLIDIFIILILATFTYRGHQGAMVAAMLYLTLTKLYGITQVPQTLILGIMIWNLFMKALYLAFRVERERKKHPPIVLENQ